MLSLMNKKCTTKTSSQIFTHISFFKKLSLLISAVMNGCKPFVWQYLVNKPQLFYTTIKSQADKLSLILISAAKNKHIRWRSLDKEGQPFIFSQQLANSV